MIVGRRLAVAILTVLVIGASACGGGNPAVIDEAAIYADLVVRVCDRARCGPSHPAFVLLERDTPEARAGVITGVADALFISTSDGLVGADDRVIDGGRLLRLGPLRTQPDDRLVLVDAFWEASRFEGKGETHVYQWDGESWSHVEPSTVP